MVTTKSKSEIEIMRQAGRIVAQVHHEMKQMIRPGLTTYDLDRHAEHIIRAAGGKPSFKGYHGFPASLCTSVNEQVVHGIPSKKLVLREGDIIGVDIGVTYKGYVGDSAWSYPVGRVAPEHFALLERAEESLWRAINAARFGNRVQDIGYAVESYVSQFGYGVVRDYCGHGVGVQLHEDPQVPNYGQPGRGDRLQIGWCLALEPMINLGTAETETLEDDWTVVTADRKYSAHFEHSIAITADGPLILTAHTEELSHRFLSKQVN